MNASALGSFPPNVAPAPRAALAVAEQLHGAAERLAILALRAAHEPSESAIADIHALGIGVSRLADELRARKDGAE